MSILFAKVEQMKQLRATDWIRVLQRYREVEFSMRGTVDILVNELPITE